jgi:type I restriction enzyme S subunit
MTMWKTATIGSVCTTFSGGTPSTSHPEYYCGDIAWIASADLNQGRIRSVKGRITRVGLERSSAKLVKSGTPLIALYSATAGVPAITYVDGAINQVRLAMIPRAIESEYFLQWLQADRESIIDRFTQDGQPNRSGAIVRNIEITLPPVSEQRRIGEVLGDADNLIAELERLITKKQAIKQVMMQELLTGGTRLSGFSDPWRMVRLGDHVSYVKTVPLSRDQLDRKSLLRYLHYGDIHTRRGVFLDTAQEPMPRASATLAGRAGQLKTGDLLFADSSEDTSGVGKSVEITGVPTDGVVAGLHTIAARFDKAVLGDGFKAYLQFIPSFRQSLLRLAAGTKVLATTRSYISSVELQLPPIDEQHAIASTLTDCERELIALHARLDKARDVKQGMMQELLTGRTRLPVQEAV